MACILLYILMRVLSLADLLLRLLLLLLLLLRYRYTLIAALSTVPLTCLLLFFAHSGQMLLRLSLLRILNIQRNGARIFYIGYNKSSFLLYSGGACPIKSLSGCLSVCGSWPESCDLSHLGNALSSLSGPAMLCPNKGTKVKNSCGEVTCCAMAAGWPVAR